MQSEERGEEREVRGGLGLGAVSATTRSSNEKMNVLKMYTNE